MATIWLDRDGLLRGGILEIINRYNQFKNNKKKLNEEERKIFASVRREIAFHYFISFRMNREITLILKDTDIEWSDEIMEIMIGDLLYFA